MHQLPETREALTEIVSLDEPDIRDLLDALGRAARRIVPQLTGLSLGLAAERLTFTLVASDAEVAALDAAQYMDGGPCVEVGNGSMDVARFVGGDPLDEKRWSLFARANAAFGVASTLSLPVYVAGELIGSVNLYAATPDAFADSVVAQLSHVVSAAPTAAVKDADLSFSTRLEAVAAPSRLRDRHTVETAVGLIAADKGMATEDAHEQLLQAAVRADLQLAQVAKVVIAAYGRRHEEPPHGQE